MTPRAALWPAAVALMAFALSACSDDLVGPAALIRLSPRDTALYVGRSFARHDTVFGALGVSRPNDDIRYSTPDTLVLSVTRSGQITGRSFGRARILASSASLVDTAWISVVPMGRLAVGRSTGTSVATLELDGSGLHSLADAGQGGGGAAAWSPDGGSIAFQYEIPGGAGASRLMTVASAGGVSTPLAGALGNVPRISRDGRWIYYRSAASGGTGEIWRTTPDGIISERIGPADHSFAGDSYPDPSPDGTEVVLSSNRALDGGWYVVVRSVPLGTDRSLGILGYSPRWSPAGDRIAYWSGDALSGLGAVYVMHADGTDAHQVSPPGRSYRVPGLDWSPDGRWLVAQGATTTELLDLETGVALPLAFTDRYAAAAWGR